MQYLTIAAIFHVREQTRRPENRRGWAFHVGIFYGASVALGYVLFVLWPDAYVAMGHEPLLTAQLVVAVINIHHFVVDAYIWRLRRDPNLRTVVDQPPSRRSLTRPGWFSATGRHRAGRPRSRIIRRVKQSTHGACPQTYGKLGIYGHNLSFGSGSAFPSCQVAKALSDKGKPAVRLGRKAADQAWCLTAGLPKKEAGSHPPPERDRYGPSGRVSCTAGAA